MCQRSVCKNRIYMSRAFHFYMILIFGFIDLALGVANFLGIYKINLNDSTYVISSEETEKDSLEDNNESN